LFLEAVKCIIKFVSWTWEYFWAFPNKILFMKHKVWLVKHHFSRDSASFENVVVSGEFCKCFVWWSFGSRGAQQNVLSWFVIPRAVFLGSFQKWKIETKNANSCFFKSRYEKESKILQYAWPRNFRANLDLKQAPN